MTWRVFFGTLARPNWVEQRFVNTAKLLTDVKPEGRFPSCAADCPACEIERRAFPWCGRDPMLAMG